MKTVVGARGYGIEMRERIVSAVKDGKSINEVARQFDVHYQTVSFYLIKDELGTLDKRRKPTGRPRKMQPEHEEQLLRQVKEVADMTLTEHVELLLEKTGFATSEATVSRVFSRNGITLKKNPLCV